MNKKGAELTIATIVIIVLALVVLVVLILGFTGGWGNLWGRISGYFGEANVDSVVQACQVACTTQSQNDWCTRTRNVNFGKDDPKNADFTCDQLAKGASGLGISLEECTEITCPE